MGQIAPDFPDVNQSPNWAAQFLTALGLMVTQGNASDALLHDGVLARAVIVSTGSEARPADADVVIWIDPGAAGASNAIATDLVVNPSELTSVADLIDAKGDLLVGSAADTLMRLAAGTNGKLLSANNATPSGLEWVDPPAGGGGGIVPGVTAALKQKAGHWFGPYNLAGPGAFAGTLNRLDLVPIWVSTSTPVDQIGVMVATAGSAGSTARLGIFNAKADGMPGTVRLDAGTVDTSSTGVKAATISQTLPVGEYFLGAVPQGGTPAVFHAFAGVDRSNFGYDWDEGYFQSSASNSTNYLTLAGVTGALADLSSASFSYRANDTIKVGLRAA